MHVSWKSFNWYWMPLTILLIGIISIILFFTIARIRVYQHENTILNSAVLHMEVDSSVFHQDIEEIISGETGVELKSAITSIDRAIDQADTILKDGTIEAEERPVSGMVAMLGLKKNLDELKSLLIELKRIGLWRLENIEKRGITSAANQQFDDKFDEILAKAAVIEEICKRNRNENQIKSHRFVLSIYNIWAFIIIAAAAGIWRVEMRRKRAEEALLESNSRLVSQAEELAQHRENLAGLVEQRTAELTSSNEQLRQEIVERLQAEATLKESQVQIRHLSGQLLWAQEIERKRISMDLHDSLGQALNVMKLRVRIVEKGLDEEHADAKEDCEGLQEYLDEVIEDVRRLSRDLSPAILEDLGLSAALRWLVSNFRITHAMRATSEIADIDGLFPENHRITIYRVIQEALTNAGKHSRAENVSVVIRRHEQRVTFAVEDDGMGIDPNYSSKRDVSWKGLGLTTMNERVKMMGGVFDLWSREGEGTRITFSVPLGNGGE